MWSRLKNEHRLAIITFLGVMTAGALLGFSAWRFVRGDGRLAALDVTISVVLLLITRLAWQPGRTELAGSAMCVMSAVFCTFAVSLIGQQATGWVYLALIANFYLASVRVATYSNLALISVASVTIMQQNFNVQGVSTTVTWLLVFFFSLLFSVRVQEHSGALQDLANIDDLTGLSNRRALEADVRRVVSDKDPGRWGMLILDIDKFKAVNDTYGHAAGDIVLKALAEILTSELRQHDTVYRFGGEEFVMLLPLTSDRALHAAADRVREAVATRAFGPGGNVTVSIGGAILRGEKDWQDWFSRADVSLYGAKGRGGNVSIIDAVPEG
ncbi:GGDEF domain-containing protein [Luteimonas sp. RIT-PG2_3]